MRKLFKIKIKNLITKWNNEIWNTWNYEIFPEILHSENDFALAKLKYSGTPKGIFSRYRTNKEMPYIGAAVFKIKNEKILDVGVLGDIYGLINQLK